MNSPSRQTSLLAKNQHGTSKVSPDDCKVQFAALHLLPIITSSTHSDVGRDNFIWIEERQVGKLLAGSRADFVQPPSRGDGHDTAGRA